MTQWKQASTPHFLTRVAANEDRVALGALLVSIMGFALVLVPVLMFPIAKRHNETLALGYVVFRGGLETVTYFGWAISWLLPTRKHIRRAANKAVQLTPRPTTTGKGLVTSSCTVLGDMQEPQITFSDSH